MTQRRPKCFKPTHRLAKVAAPAYSCRAMNFLRLIEAKRDGAGLSDADIVAVVGGFTGGAIPDYQMAAFLMAVFFRGLDPRETRSLTLAMRDSGTKLKFPKDRRPLVDKHSTGGVGDKVSLPLAPLLACLGFRVPMISGRGLGITGGTLDKLESIPGFRTGLSETEIVDQVQRLGVAMGAQSATMVPADRLMYALRDVTGTVPSIPLITASILSKKLSESLDALVLDVKFGRAAFMQTKSQAVILAKTMARLAEDCGVATRSILSPMDAPLGRAAGNWLEVRESVECLNNKGPADLRALVVECAAHLLRLTGRAPSFAAGRKQASDCLATRQPLAKWEAMLAAQGADLAAYHAKLAKGDTAKVVSEIPSPRSGVIRDVDARVIGEVVRDLGGGRLTKGAAVDFEVGVDAMKQIGERVRKAEPLARVHVTDPTTSAKAVERVRSAFVVSAR